MPARYTNYAKTLGKSKKKRTSRLTRKQAMSHRHRTIAQTRICPEGQRLINGKCSGTSGVGFSGTPSEGTLSTNPDNISKGDWVIFNINPSDPQYSAANINNLIQSNSPIWMDNKLNALTISKILRFLNGQRMQSYTLSVIEDKWNKAVNSNRNQGMRIIESIGRDLPQSWWDFINDHGQTNTNFMGLGPIATKWAIIGACIIIAIIIAT